jgi:SAM-dependent methyltransferase
MRFVSRALFSIGQIAARVSRLVNYIAASTLSLAELKDGIRHSWDDFHAREEDIASGLMDWEQDLVARFVKPEQSVLLVGVGSGRDLLPLVERGCRVTGVDPASSALERAGRALVHRQLSAILIEGFLEDVDVNGRFDVVMFSYYSYSYIPASGRRVEALRKAVDHLNSCGYILISYPPLIRPRPILITAARTFGRLCRSDWLLEPGDLISVENGSFRGYSHAFRSDEIEAEAAAAGLRIVYRCDYPDPVVALAAAAPGC